MSSTQGRHDATVYHYDWADPPGFRWQWECACGRIRTDLGSRDDAEADWRIHALLEMPEGADPLGMGWRLLLEVWPPVLTSVRAG